jgi:hypothetical protein
MPLAGKGGNPRSFRNRDERFDASRRLCGWRVSGLSRTRSLSQVRCKGQLRPRRGRSREFGSWIPKNVGWRPGGGIPKHGRRPTAHRFHPNSTGTNKRSLPRPGERPPLGVRSPPRPSASRSPTRLTRTDDRSCPGLLKAIFRFVKYAQMCNRTAMSTSSESQMPSTEKTNTRRDRAAGLTGRANAQGEHRQTKRYLGPTRCIDRMARTPRRARYRCHC